MNTLCKKVFSFTYIGATRTYGTYRYRTYFSLCSLNEGSVAVKRNNQVHMYLLPKSAPGCRILGVQLLKIFENYASNLLAGCATWSLEFASSCSTAAGLRGVNLQHFKHSHLRNLRPFLSSSCYTIDRVCVNILDQSLPIADRSRIPDVPRVCIWRRPICFNPYPSLLA